MRGALLIRLTTAPTYCTSNATAFATAAATRRRVADFHTPSSYPHAHTHTRTHTHTLPHPRTAQCYPWQYVGVCEDGVGGHGYARNRMRRRGGQGGEFPVYTRSVGLELSPADASLDRCGGARPPVGDTSATAVGPGTAVMVAARRLGVQRARRAQGGIRLYDDERRRPLLISNDSARRGSRREAGPFNGDGDGDDKVRHSDYRDYCTTTRMRPGQCDTLGRYVEFEGDRQGSGCHMRCDGEGHDPTMAG